MTSVVLILHKHSPFLTNLPKTIGACLAKARDKPERASSPQATRCVFAMTLQQFLSVTKDVPPAKVTHAMDTVLAGGPPPCTPPEHLRFRALVWLELQGRLEHPA